MAALWTRDNSRPDDEFGTAPATALFMSRRQFSGASVDAGHPVGGGRIPMIEFTLQCRVHRFERLKVPLLRTKAVMEVRDECRCWTEIKKQRQQVLFATQYYAQPRHATASETIDDNSVVVSVMRDVLADCGWVAWRTAP